MAVVTSLKLRQARKPTTTTAQTKIDDAWREVEASTSAVSIFCDTTRKLEASRRLARRMLETETNPLLVETLREALAVTERALVAAWRCSSSANVRHTRTAESYERTVASGVRG